MPLESISAKFGVVLRRRREAAGISLPAVAALTGLHRTTIGQIELGSRNASLRAADALARAVGSTVATLIVEAEKRASR